MNKDKEFIVENLSVLIDSGMDIIAALESIKNEVRYSSTKKFIDSIKEKVEVGAPLWSTLQKKRFLPEASISLIRIGELSGKLAENLNLVAIQAQKDRSFRSKIRSAMLYPVLVLSLMVSMGIGIAWFILPRLATVFANLKIKLPLITKILIEVGVFLDRHGLFAVPLSIMFLMLLFYFLFIFEKTKFIGLRIAFSIPVIDKLIQEIEIARFTYILGTLLEAGLPVLEALESVSSATTFPFYKKIYVHLHDSIAEGNSFQKAFLLKKNIGKFIPNVIQQVIVAGEKSGNLSKSLLKIASNYEEKTETTSKNLTVLLEPVLLIIIWLGVMAVALAVILPIYSLIGNLNNNI